MHLALLVFLVVSDEAASARDAAYARLPLARKIAADRVFLRAIEDRNKTVETADEVRRRDEEWIRNPQYPLRKQLTQNECATRLKELIRADTLVVEAFLTDRRGCLVCSTVETQDYWQGDEPKWQKTYGDGKPVLLEEPSLDANTGTFAVQLSVLVTQGEQRIGVLTLTLKVPRSLGQR
jgi:hypothetical protein